MFAAKPRYVALGQARGFTLIESIIGIVVFALALSVLFVTLFPKIGKSAEPHYQARASALGQAVMSEVLSRQFDRNSDQSGSRWRCGENAEALKNQGIASPSPVPACSDPLKAGDELLALEDFIGCWGEDESVCTQPYRGSLSQLIGGNAGEFVHFTVNINVTYDPSLGDGADPHLYKRVDVTVDAERYGRYAFAAYRSNY